MSTIRRNKVALPENKSSSPVHSQLINPRLQEIPPSGIRAFLIWQRVTTILYHLE